LLHLFDYPSDKFRRAIIGGKKDGPAVLQNKDGPSRTEDAQLDGAPDLCLANIVEGNGPSPTEQRRPTDRHADLAPLQIEFGDSWRPQYGQRQRRCDKCERPKVEAKASRRWRPYDDHANENYSRWYEDADAVAGAGSILHDHDMRLPADFHEEDNAIYAICQVKLRPRLPHTS
jgi:hypothetical protein